MTETDFVKIAQQIAILMPFILDEREKLVVNHRFGLNGFSQLTLEKLGLMEHITRERIRQIENISLKKILERLGIDISKIKFPSYLPPGEKHNDLIAALAKRGGHVYKKLHFETISAYVDNTLLNKFRKILKTVNKLKDKPTLVKKEFLTEYMDTEGIPEIWKNYFIDKLTSGITRKQAVIDILHSNGYPMHFSEVYEELKSYRKPVAKKVVLNILHDNSKIFARVSSGTYVLIGPNQKKSVPFIIDLITEYFKTHATGTPKEIFDYVASRRQCSYNSVILYLSMNNAFKLISRGVYSLRDPLEIIDIPENEIERGIYELSNNGVPKLQDLILFLRAKDSNYSVTDVLNYLHSADYQIIDDKLIKKVI